MPDATLSTLDQIRIKVRKLTRTPSEAQLSTPDIDNYVNTFVLYDFPEHLRLFDLRTVFTFYVQPYIDTYDTNTTLFTDPLFNFKNQYISLHPPLFIAGYQCLFSQSREQFFTIYPFVTSISSIGPAGDGVTTSFSGTLSSVPVIRNQVLFSSVDINNNGLSLIDNPSPGTQIGQLVIPDDTVVSYGTINYVTGAYSFTFPVAPQQGAAINSQTVPYVASLPQALLFYDDIMTVRPIPDQPYQVNLEAYIRPTELLNSTQQPDIAQWWQYIAYGATKKIFEDRMDIESVQLIMPEFMAQQQLVIRKTIVQNTNDRVSTIYQDSTGNNNGYDGSGWLSGPFF
jgi:hypothetical protein